MRTHPATLALLVLLSGITSAQVHRQKEPVDYVSPNIGGIGQLLTATIPYVQRPHGMVRLAPITTPGITDRYLADKIYGFPAGAATLMASVGEVGTRPETYASDFDHDFETATPYYYEADLQTWGIKSEFTATEQAAYYRFTFPASQHAHLVLSAADGAKLQVTGVNTVEGSQRITGTVGKTSDTDKETREYFYAKFSRPLQSYQTWKGNDLSHAAEQTGDNIGIVTDIGTTAGEQIEVRVGISYISAEQARKNLEREIPGGTFDQVKSQTREIWNNALAGMDVTGGTERQRTIFYTALYRSLGRMTDITEDGKYFSGYDHSVHDAGGHDFYIDDGLWDTYRSLHPLQLLLNSRQQEDMVRSYLRMYEQDGWLPSFPSVAGEQAVMIGHHAAPFILDLYAKGYRDFDVNEAYAAMRKNATEATMLPWRRGPLTSLDHVYFDKGFFPALLPGEKETAPEVTPEKRQAVSVTLENSYDDWCVAQLAKALGKQSDAAYFGKLAANYRNVFDTGIGFMAPKGADGNWIAGFDPKLGGGQGGRDYFTEVDSWIYTFNVQHDPSGLIQLFGGRDAFNAKLDRLFVEQYGTSKFSFLGQFPDATGLVGLYAQGNEPSFHIPYLYDFSGQPWKTQRRVRQLMDVWYGDGPLGIPGDDDGGATSSWYVFSALGFYPVCPGVPIYEIGSPIFAKTAIRQGNGKLFTIVANHVSDQNKYIQSAQLNGKPLDRPWFPHSAVANGGSLVLEMGDKPNTKWGSSQEDAPPSTSDEHLGLPTAE
ncbi:GH92 family glycosyl hydrolase [Acidicapsa acidisoli]|uniref:GH92 family glycosyl hydrolase n=1 Tax=Acidicapsa acidisoli TaxID=1615681 RepID=UPI0021DFF302|nr:GH92 family glycosyl hydrolase [Acidicapsa acidisoli]